MPTKAELEAALEQVVSSLSEVERELKEFKERVQEKAHVLGSEYSMCGVLDAALEELGMEGRYYECKVVISRQVTLGLRIRSDVASKDKVESWLDEQLNDITDVDGFLDGYDESVVEVVEAPFTNDDDTKSDRFYVQSISF